MEQVPQVRSDNWHRDLRTENRHLTSQVTSRRSQPEDIRRQEPETGNQLESDLLKSFRVPEILPSSDQHLGNDRCGQTTHPPASQSKRAKRLLAVRRREEGDCLCAQSHPEATIVQPAFPNRHRTYH